MKAQELLGVEVCDVALMLGIDCGASAGADAMFAVQGKELPGHCIDCIGAQEAIDEGRAIAIPG